MKTSIKQLVRCINDRNRPDDIPISKWIKKGELYTIKSVHHAILNDCTYYVLEELDLKGCGLYDGFSTHRFEPYWAEGYRR